MDTTSVIPSWQRIKDTNLSLFYDATNKLSEFRKINLSDKAPSSLIEEKQTLWIGFCSSLIDLYMLNKSSFKLNKKTEKYYKILKVLEKYTLDLSKINYVLGIKLFSTMEEVLYKSGLLNIGIQDEDIEHAFED